MRRSHVLVLVAALCVLVIGFDAVGTAQTSGTSQTTPQVIDGDQVYLEQGLVYFRARLPRVQRENLDEYGKKVYDAIIASDPSYKNGVRSALALWLNSPRVAEPAFGIRNYIRDMPLGHRLTELAILVTSRE